MLIGPAPQGPASSQVGPGLALWRHPEVPPRTVLSRAPPAFSRVFQSCSRQRPRPCLADSGFEGEKKKATHSPPHTKKIVSVPCGKESGDASEPDWKQRRPTHAPPRLSVTQSFDGVRVCPPHTRLQRGAGGYLLPLSPPPTSACPQDSECLKLAVRSRGTVLQNLLQLAENSLLP